MTQGSDSTAEPDPQRLAAELHQARVELAEARQEVAAALAQADAAQRASATLAEAVAAALGALWVADARTGEGIYVSPGVGALLGVPPGAVLPEAGRWLGLVHPDDRAAVASRFAALCAGAGTSEVSYQVLPAGAGTAGQRPAAPWVSDLGFPIRDARGHVRRVAGFAHAAAGGGEDGLRRLLLAELNHRVRNALAAVQAVAAQTVRAAPEPATFWEAFAGRLRAMARAHDTLAGRGWSEGMELRALFEAELAPYLHASGPTGPRVELDGPPVRLVPATAVALALAAHELATNAARHGALSVAAGRVRVRWRMTDPVAGRRRLRLEWVERGGPPMDGAPARRGFGARLLAQALPAQLGGRVSLDFAPDGLRAVMEAALPAENEPAYAPLPSAAPAGPGPARAAGSAPSDSGKTITAPKPPGA